MELGVNPLDKKRNALTSQKTLEETFSDFKQARKSLKPKTLYDYDKLLNRAFKDWKKKSITSISKEMVSKRHLTLGEKNGGAYANLAMRFLRSLFNFAAAQYEDDIGGPLISENPVKRISQTKSWYKVDRRKTFQPKS